MELEHLGTDRLVTRTGVIVQRALGERKRTNSHRMPTTRCGAGRAGWSDACDDGCIDLIAAIVVGYLIGSIPSAYVVGRLVAGIDVRVEGEGNVGARNVFHTVGRGWGVLVFVADFAKGLAVAVLFLGSPDSHLWLATTAALAGHCLPVWIRFVGGKGLATAGGVAVALMPWAAAAGTAAAGAVWVARRRFLPTTVAAIVVGIVAAPWLGTSATKVALVVWLFALTGVKRAIDEPRMRSVEAATGWDRVRGLGA